jgi:hypothetical protein
VGEVGSGEEGRTMRNGRPMKWSSTALLPLCGAPSTSALSVERPTWPLVRSSGRRLEMCSAACTSPWKPRYCRNVKVSSGSSIALSAQRAMNPFSVSPPAAVSADA